MKLRVLKKSLEKSTVAEKDAGQRQKVLVNSTETCHCKGLRIHTGNRNLQVWTASWSFSILRGGLKSQHIYTQCVYTPFFTVGHNFHLSSQKKTYFMVCVVMLSPHPHDVSQNQSLKKGNTALQAKDK